MTGFEIGHENRWSKKTFNFLCTQERFKKELVGINLKDVNEKICNRESAILLLIWGGGMSLNIVVSFSCLPCTHIKFVIIPRNIS